MEPAANAVGGREGRLNHPVGGAIGQTRGVIEARGIVRDRGQELVLIVGANAAADEQAGRAFVVPAQSGPGAGGEAQAAFHQVVAGETIHAEQRAVVQLQSLAVLVGDARIKVGVGRGRKLDHRLQDQIRSSAEATIERVADVHAGAGATAREHVRIDAHHRRQVIHRIDIDAGVHERLPAQAHGRDDRAAPIDLAADAAAVDAGQSVGRAGRNQLGR
ncbi:hypothetical protein D3C80_1200350 [compost metagenome]